LNCQSLLEVACFANAKSRHILYTPQSPFEKMSKMGLSSRKALTSVMVAFVNHRVVIAT